MHLIHLGRLVLLAIMSKRFDLLVRKLEGRLIVHRSRVSVSSVFTTLIVVLRLAREPVLVFDDLIIRRRLVNWIDSLR